MRAKEVEACKDTIITLCVAMVIVAVIGLIFNSFYQAGRLSNEKAEWCDSRGGIVDGYMFANVFCTLKEPKTGYQYVRYEVIKANDGSFGLVEVGGSR